MATEIIELIGGPMDGVVIKVNSPPKVYLERYEYNSPVDNYLRVYTRVPNAAPTSCGAVPFTYVGLEDRGPAPAGGK